MTRPRALWALLFVSLPAAASSAPPSGVSEALVWPGAVAALEARLGAERVEVRRRAAAELGRLPAPVLRRLLPRLFADPDPEVRLAVADAAIAARLPGAGARVGKWLSDPDARVREAAAEVLEVVRDAGSIPGLGRALEDVDASVRIAAARALGNAQREEAVSFLLGHLDDADPEVRHAVIAALADLGDARAVLPLIGRLQEQRAALRQKAAAALGELGDARAVAALVVALGDGDAGVRMAAAASLGALKAADAVWSLGALLETEADPSVQSAALDALGAIGTAAAVEASLRALALPQPSRAHLVSALGHAGEAALPALEQCVFQPPQPESAELCVAALGSIASPRSSLLIERALRQRAVRPATALEALGAVGQPAALPTVLEFLTSPAAPERRAAIDAAGALLAPEREVGLAVEPIAQALSRARGSRLERAALLGLLGQTGSPRAAPPLLAAAQSADEYVRAMAFEALGQIGPTPGGEEALLTGLGAGSFPTRYTAALALRRAGRRQSLEPLLERLTGAPKAERELIAVALGGPLGDAPGDAALARATSAIESASDERVQDALIEALAHAPGPAGARALEGLLSDVGGAGRAKVAEALAGHVAGRPPLLRLLDDADHRVRANAAWALGGVGTDADVAKLSALLREPDHAVAANAAAAIGRIAARQASAGSEGSSSREGAATVLCAALDDERAYVLANALAGLRAAGLGCEEGAAVEWQLEHHPSEEVRAAAARLIRDRGSPNGQRALRRCAAKDVSGRVALECAAPTGSPRPAGEARDVGVLVVATGQAEPAPRHPFALVRADGLIRCGTSDRRGAVWEASAPLGPLRLALPAAFTP